MKEKIEAHIILMTFCVSGALHMAAIPAGIVYTVTFSSNLALLSYLGSFIMLLPLCWLVFVKMTSYAAKQLMTQPDTVTIVPPKQTNGTGVKVYHNGKRLPEVERYINAAKHSGVGGSGTAN